MYRFLAACLILTATSSRADLSAIRALQPDQGQEVRHAIEQRVSARAQTGRADLERELLEIFRSPDTTLEGRQYSCRMLRLCASNACVPALAPALADPALSSFVRLVFQHLDSEAVDAALIEALPGPTPELTAGLIGTLGQRGAPTSVSAVKPFLDATDPRVQRAAIVALGHIGGKAAGASLARATVPPAQIADWKQAQLRAARDLPPPHRAAVYRRFVKDPDDAIRAAAFVGLTTANPGLGAPRVLQALDDENPRMRQVAAGLLTTLTTQDLVDALDHLPPTHQVRVMAALSHRDAPEAEDALLGLTSHEVDEVSDAAYRTLATIGGAKSIPLLIAAAPTRPAAFAALCALPAAGTDTAMISALETGDEALRVAMLNGLAARKCEKALATISGMAQGPWSRSSRTAIDTFAAIAGNEDVAQLGTWMLTAGEPARITALEKGIADAAQRLSDPTACARTLISTFNRATGEARYALLRALGALGGDEVRNLLQEALESQDAQLQDAAVRGLSHWRTIDAADQLLDLARTADDARHRILALRGYIRLANEQNDPGTVLAMCREAAASTERPAELISVISCAKRHYTEENFQFLISLLDNPEVAREAGWALLDLSYHWLLKQNATEPLKKIAAQNLDPDLTNRATSRIEEIAGP